MIFSKELIEKAKNAKDVEELIALAKQNNIELSENNAKHYFDILHSNAPMSDEELDAVAGGKGDELRYVSISSADPRCTSCGDKLFVVKDNYSTPLTCNDKYGNYNLHGCYNCKIKFRHYWDGDYWTLD